MPRKAKENATKINVEKDKIKHKNEINIETSSKVKVSKKSDTSSKKVTDKTSKEKVKSKSNVKESIRKTTTKSKKSTNKKSSSVKSLSNLKSTSLTTKPRNKSKKVNKVKDEKLSNLTNNADKPVVLEYYDLPYKYNKTVVKALAQNPNTLFVYWEISDEDRNDFIKKYGKDFFNITRPVLIVHNITDKYSFEINIDDFANNWYIHVNDSKCQYSIELGRRFKESNDIVNEDYLYITSSNMIESPNDHVLFFKDTNEVYFKNIHTNKYTTKVLRPFILNNIKSIYKKLKLSEQENLNRFDFNNPSSQNPTSSF